MEMQQVYAAGNLFHSLMIN